MSNRSVQNILAIVLIVIALTLLVGILAMWMMPSMMGGMMGNMMGGRMIGGRALCVIGPLTLAAVLIVLAVMLFRNRT